MDVGDSQAHLKAAADAFIVACPVVAAGDRFAPLAEAREPPDSGEVDLEPPPSAEWAGAVVVLLTVGLYAVFW